MFQNDNFSILGLVAIAIFSAVLSWLYYFWRPQQNAFSKPYLWLFFSLRGAIFFLLGLLLLGLVFPLKSKRTEPANIFVLVDQSSSVLNYKDSSRIKKLMPEIVASFEKQLQGKFLTRFFTFSSEVEALDTLRYDGTSSNLAACFSYIRDLYLNNNIGAIVIVSDGNYNEGINPRYEAEKIKFTPVYSLGLGDTLTKRDVMISNVVANNIAFAGNTFPIKFEAKATKLKNKKVKAKLIFAGKVQQEKSFQISDNQFFFESTFLVEATGKGIQSYRIELHTEGVEEYTLSNNARNIYIEILESKRKANIVVGGLHPDAGALQSVLQRDQNTDVTVSFLNELKEVPKTDLLIFIDIDFSQNPTFFKALQSSDTPYLLFVNPNMTTANLNAGLIGHSPGRADFVNGQFNEDFSLIQFSEVFRQRLKDWPPVSTPFAREMKSIGQTLLYQKVSNISTTKPLMIFTNRGNQKIAYFFGDGIWRWRLMEFNRYQDNLGFEELWDKTLQYLSIKENRDKLRVFPPSRMTVKDELRFRAEFYNDAFQRINTPQIVLKLKDEKSKIVSNYTLNKFEDDYELNIGKLAPGVYRWDASTSFNGTKYQKNGEFVVEDVSLESLDLSSNFDVLLDLSEYSSGKFYKLDNWQQLISEIESNKELSSTQFDETSYTKLIDLKWIFLVLLLLVSVEWFFRRWLGSY